jgi:gamma-glutamyl-gamma-aminobutyrate hydrolase PuuD
MGRTSLRAASFHRLQVPPSQKLLTINAWSADGVVEGVEYADHMLGVQFHPEVDGLLPEIFSFLT